MPQAYADADQLELFATRLELFITELKQNIVQLQGQFVRLGETWRDQEQARFEQEFGQTVQSITPFLRDSEAQLFLLRRKAARIREYAGQSGSMSGMNNSGSSSSASSGKSSAESNFNETPTQIVGNRSGSELEPGEASQGERRERLEKGYGSSPEAK